MSPKTTSFILLRSQKFRTFYAGRGRRSGVAVRGSWEGTPEIAVGSIVPTGRTAPKAPAGQPCLDDELFPCLAMPIWHWPEPNKWQMIPRQITMSLDRQNCAYKTCQHGTVELFTSSGQGLLIFDPLDNRVPSLLANYQKVSRLKESQEVASKWGLDRSA